MFFRWLLVVIAIFSVTGCNNSVRIKLDQKKNQGIYSDRVVFGSSLALKGHAGYLGVQSMHGAMSYIRHINEKGGVHGRKIEIIAYDDSYEPTACLANTQKLIVSDRVFGLFGYVGTPTTVRALPMIEDAEIPLVGILSGANAFRYPFNKNVINVRPSYYEETRAAVRHFVSDLDIRKIAVFYQYDAYGFDGLTGTELALKNYGLAPVGRGSYVRGATDIQEGLDKIISSGAEAVFLIGTAEPCAEFVRMAAEKGFNPVYYMVSFVGGDQFIKCLGKDNNQRILMSQVVPPQVAESRTGAEVSEYAQLLNKYYPGETPDFVGLEGFLNARVLVKGLQRSGRKLTRERFIQGIEGIRNYHIAPGVKVSFSSKKHQGMDRIYFTRLIDDSFTPVKDWERLRGIFR
ncbi:ABC transporter substrate-binding protein [Maridesulfovibrio bastinii]|uniref:ABC transporter substrate-binding protein n=1 Tax=Maridesulfovibrio bastinii TaxID=47157 RepID=UPI000410C0C6|nr:ABC transporter substrate-binding protein [Maridesulfovibrio bastinii]